MNNFVVKKFPLHADLTAITGFLRERGIQHRIYEEAGEQVLSVADERMLGPIAQFLGEVEAGKLVIEQEQRVALEPTALDGKGVLNQALQFPVALSLIVFSAIGALLVGLKSPLAYWLTFQEPGTYQLLPLRESLQHGHLWRLITPAFLHFGFIHFLFNSMWMWDLGRRLEIILGRLGFIVFFALVAAFSNLAQYLWQPNTLFGGMSGVVYALLGFVMVSHKLKPHPLTAVPIGVIGFMLFWLVLCMSGAIDVFIGGGVANAAHLGGLIAGCLCALIRHFTPARFV
jgi:GlpG protein